MIFDKVKIKNNWYTPKVMEQHNMPEVKNDLISRGFDGITYLMISMKGKDRLGLRCATTGEFYIC